MVLIKYLLLLITLFCAAKGSAQITVQGRVLDKSKINLVENVLVRATNGNTSSTDSLGRYMIAAGQQDSIYFIYDGKATPKYAVKTIEDLRQFDISIHKNIPGKYTTLSEVVVSARSFREDSIANRVQLAKYFDYRKAGAHITMNNDGSTGLDINELINTFRFKRNRQLKGFQKWLEYTEQEKYITYRFNEQLVKGLTGLEKPRLDTFIKLFRPEFELLVAMSDWQLGEYILNANKRFQNLRPMEATLPKQE